MTIDTERRGEGDLAGGDQPRRIAQRIAELDADDSQFRAAWPDVSVLEAVRAKDLRLVQVLETLVEGYANRPALGRRGRDLVLNPSTGRKTTRLLPSFDTITYGEMWSRVRAIASALANDPCHSVRPGDFVVTIGFASPEYLIIDLVCAYLGLVSVPLQHNSDPAQLAPIVAEVEPQ